eukprot:CAMPEP_0114108944 /NCGR_PEP_ID=MMETSP0043_2-20121206/501_1 /TAXON_ID=464988 /ORGANISM="Hemiselmis andersenii, Strain CCMP644" /LENGTH=170 /DNA_ID=CAMNT_0001200765 /DNA_START=159 /DNA_END=671 /DNA_ORIENTATION=-
MPTGPFRARPSDLDLEKRGPKLASDPKPIPVLVPRDAVENILTVRLLRPLGMQATQVDPTNDAPIMGRNARDRIPEPYVGPDLPVHVLKLVHHIKRLALVRHMQCLRDLKRRRVPVHHLVRTVAHNQARPVVAQPPARRLVREPLDFRESFEIIDDAHVVLPCQLVDQAL